MSNTELLIGNERIKNVIDYIMKKKLKHLSKNQSKSNRKITDKLDYFGTQKIIDSQRTIPNFTGIGVNFCEILLYKT